MTGTVRGAEAATQQLRPIDSWSRLALNPGASATVGSLCHAASWFIGNSSAGTLISGARGNDLLHSNDNLLTDGLADAFAIFRIPDEANFNA